MKLKNNKEPIFDFEKLGTEKGATKAYKDIVKIFSDLNLNVLDESANMPEIVKGIMKSGKVAGYDFRTISVNFTDSQSVSFNIKSSGDIFRVKINGKETPITNQDDHKAAIAEIIGKLNKGRVAFTKRLAKRADPTPTTATPRTTTTKKKQIEQLTVQRDSLASEISVIDGQINAMRDEMKQAA